jgi:hypothetical protein
MVTIEQWAFGEWTFEGPTSGNPYIDVSFSAVFRQANRDMFVRGFYDGDGVYRLRFMPDTPGEWQFSTVSNVPDLNGRTRRFVCVPAQPGNHGPVSVWGQTRFAYADGTPYFQIGTTCYAWAHQGVVLEQQTIRTLAESPFNKLRMCVFPKHYRFNHNEPPLYAYEKKADGSFDFERFNPAFFQHYEDLLAALRTLNIEADLILFHPYDRWGFADMEAEQDNLYLRYIIARFAAFRNVWWSLANEYDLMRAKTELDWDRFFRIVQAEDPYHHLRSIHNCRAFYDHSKPWVTHASIQHSDLARVGEWRMQYGKPVVDDECQYEGNIENQWGNITARELTHRFWEGTLRGGYVGHGETYRHPEDILWWSKGGVLRGESPARICFLRDVLADVVQQLVPMERAEVMLERQRYASARIGDEYFIIYFGNSQVGGVTLQLPPGNNYRLELIDTWEMTVTPLGDVREEQYIELPTKPNLALRFTAVG